MSRYEETATKVRELKIESDCQSIHKLIAEYDNLNDMLYSRLDHVMVPERPSPVDDVPGRDELEMCGLRRELQVIMNRLRTQNHRLNNMLGRIDL